MNRRRTARRSRKVTSSRASRLFFSQKGADDSWEAASGKQTNFCLVLSRQCVVEHKPTLTVAAVDRSPGEALLGQDLTSTIFYLESLRDGNKSPDLFYLGQLPATAGRYCARLDYIATIAMPRVPAERQEFIDQNRVAKLNLDYVRALHIRMFQAFASMGYEDYQWVSDADLRWLLITGSAEIKKYGEEEKVAKSAIAAGGKADSVIPAKIEAIRGKMKPYLTEWSKRFPNESFEPVEPPVVVPPVAELG